MALDINSSDTGPAAKIPDFRKNRKKPTKPRTLTKRVGSEDENPANEVPILKEKPVEPKKEHIPAEPVKTANPKLLDSEPKKSSATKSPAPNKSFAKPEGKPENKKLKPDKKEKSSKEILKKTIKPDKQLAHEEKYPNLKEYHHIQKLIGAATGFHYFLLKQIFPENNEFKLSKSILSEICQVGQSRAKIILKTLIDTKLIKQTRPADPINGISASYKLTPITLGSHKDR